MIFEFNYACLPSGVWRSVSTSILHLLQSKFCDACFLCLNSCGFFFIMKIVANTITIINAMTTPTADPYRDSPISKYEIQK